ncbi:flippase [Ulvibacterium sp.]|uniref:flippase n=1 Tax=Ulvibacterium sp. TaxID=2665914 RepID=UPI002621042B|nr:flippase [Ulvibacterium sp.]
MKGTKRKIKEKAFNLVWGVLAKFFAGAKLSLLSIVVARFLGPEDFGLLSYVVSFVSLFSVLAEFRLQNILVREFSEKKASKQDLLGTSLLICVFFAFVGYSVLTIIVLLIEDDFIVKCFILIYGLSYFFQCFRFLRAFFISSYNNKFIIRAESITALLVLILAVILVYFNSSVTAFVVLRTIDFLIFSVLLVFIYQNKHGNVFKWSINNRLKWKLIKDSSPLVLSGFAVVLIQRVDQVMIRNFIDDFAVGQYSAAVSLVSAIVFVPIILSESLAPTLVEKKARHDEDYLAFKQKFSDYLIWGSLLVSFLIMLTSDIIIKLIYGPEYQPAIGIMKIFAYKGFLVAMGAVAGQIMIVENTHQIAYIKSIISGAVNILLNYILIIQFGMVGAVWASIIAFILSSYLLHFFMKRYRDIFWIQTKSLMFGWLTIAKDLSNRITK